MRATDPLFLHTPRLSLLLSAVVIFIVIVAVAFALSVSATIVDCTLHGTNACGLD
jgi:hypothetical protein